mmetsp:Transcript_70632/g.169256  ORF Transcript_70632/g.169256 Transcript_70632/m.169256 type:complete len:293 (-) Transcript_70632:82-960(-)
MVIQVPLELVGVEGPVPWHYELPEKVPIEFRRLPDLWEAIERGLLPHLNQFEGLADEKRRQQKTVCVSLCMVAFLAAATNFLGIADYIWVSLLAASILVAWRLWWVRRHMPGIYALFEQKLEEGVASVIKETSIPMSIVKGDMIYEETFKGKACDAQRGGQPELFIEIEVAMDDVPVVAEEMEESEQPLSPLLHQPLVPPSASRSRSKEESSRTRSKEDPWIKAKGKEGRSQSKDDAAWATSSMSTAASMSETPSAYASHKDIELGGIDSDSKDGSEEASDEEEPKGSPDNV